MSGDDIVRTWAEAGEREPLLVLEPLREYLRDQGMPDALRSVELIGDGLSNATFRLRLTRGSDLVLRRPPRGPLPPSAHDVLREAHVTARLAASGVRVPRIVSVCADPSVIGAPFYLTEHLRGEVPVQSLPPALDEPAHRRRYGEVLAETLAEIHGVDLDETQLRGLGPPSGHLERQIGRYRTLWAHHRTRDLPAVDRVAEWLGEHLPAQRELTLVHGDFHPANVMITADPPPRAVAVLDWELATLGDPLADVGYLCALWREAGDPPGHPLERGPVTRGAGSLSRAELMGHYAAVSGRSVKGHGWYEVLALWRAAIFTEGNYRRAASGTADSPFLQAAGAAAPRLVELAAQRVEEIESGR